MAWNILIADDRDDDVFLLRLALERAGVRNAINVVSDGRDVVRYLTGESPFDDRQAYPAPRSLFVDLKLPLMDGFEISKWIRRQPGLNGLPVFVVSGLDDLGTVRRVYELGANSFLRKPYHPVDIENLIHGFPQFWMRSALST